MVHEGPLVDDHAHIYLLAKGKVVDGEVVDVVGIDVALYLGECSQSSLTGGDIAYVYTGRGIGLHHTGTQHTLPPTEKHINHEGIKTTA